MRVEVLAPIDGAGLDAEALAVRAREAITAALAGR